MCCYAFQNGSWLDLGSNNATLTPLNGAKFGPNGLQLIPNGSSSDGASSPDQAGFDVAITENVAFFVKFRSTGVGGGDYPPFFSTRPWATGVDAGLAFGLEGTTMNRLNVHFANGAAGVDVPSARSGTFTEPIGRWIKGSVLVNQISPTKLITFYIDHALNATTVSTSAFSPIAIAPASTMTIGVDIAGGGSRYFRGHIQYLCILKQTTDFTATQETQIHAELDSICAAQQPVQTTPGNFLIPDNTPNLVSQVAMTSQGVWDTQKAEKMTVGQNIAITKSKVLGQTFTGLSTGGSGVRIAGATNSGVSGAAAASMDFWVSGVTSTSRMCLGSLGANSNGAAFGLELSTAVADGCLNLVGFNRNAATTARPINDGGLHHVGVTYDGVTTAKFYVDGVEAAATAALASALSITNSPFHVGQAVYDSGYGFRSAIHSARLWNKTLTAAEFKSLYERAKV